MDKEKESLKIEGAKDRLPKESLLSINKIDWKKILSEVMSKKYNQEQVLKIREETELLLYNLLDPEDYIEELKSELNISIEEALGIAKELDSVIFQKIKIELENIIKEKEDIPAPPYTKDSNQNANDIPVPLPPKKLPTLEKKDLVDDTTGFKNAGIEMVESKKTIDNNSEDEKSFSMKEDHVLVDSGISMIEEVPKVEKEHLLPNIETQKSVLSGVEHPQAGVSSIMAQKLGGDFTQTQKIAYHSTDDTTKPDSTTTQKDPYHEPIE